MIFYSLVASSMVTLHLKVVLEVNGRKVSKKYSCHGPIVHIPRTIVSDMA